jgi:hypothetical protein
MTAVKGANGEGPKLVRSDRDWEGDMQGGTIAVFALGVLVGCSSGGLEGSVGNSRMATNATPAIEAVLGGQNLGWTLIQLSSPARTIYFDTSDARLCFTFTAPGKWLPTEEKGLLRAPTGPGMIGALILSSRDIERRVTGGSQDPMAALERIHVEDFAARGFGPPASSSVSPFPWRGSRAAKWTGSWPAPQGDMVAVVVRYFAEVAPDWYAVVVSSPEAGASDAFARRLLDSFEVDTGSDCFASEIASALGKT